MNIIFIAYGNCPLSLKCPQHCPVVMSALKSPLDYVSQDAPRPTKLQHPSSTDYSTQRRHVHLHWLADHSHLNSITRSQHSIHTFSLWGICLAQPCLTLLLFIHGFIFCFWPCLFVCCHAFGFLLFVKNKYTYLICICSCVPFLTPVQHMISARVILHPSSEWTNIIVWNKLVWKIWTQSNCREFFLYSNEYWVII